MRVALSLWRFFQSRNLALTLLLFIALAITLGLIIPQQGHVDPQVYTTWQSSHPGLFAIIKFFSLDTVFSSWWLLAVVGLLVTNTLACTLGRVTQIIRQQRFWQRLEEPQLKVLTNHASSETNFSVPQVLSRLENRLRRKGYRVDSETESGQRTFLYASKGELAPWGSLLFHFSFVVLLGGVVFTWMTYYTGAMAITEGQLVSPPSAGFEVGLDRFSPVYQQGMSGADYAAHLVVLENNVVVKQRTVKVNQPLDYKGFSFVLQRYGFAPYFELKGEKGEEIFGSFVNLRVVDPSSRDSFVIPGTNLSVTASFYPNFSVENGTPSTRSLEPLNPVLDIVVSDAGTQVFKGLLSKGGNVTFEQKSLAFTDLRYWTGYKVTKDPGKNVIYSSFWLAVLGISVRYLVTQKKIWAFIQETPTGSNFTIGAVAAQQDSLFNEEFTRLVSELMEE